MPTPRRRTPKRNRETAPKVEHIEENELLLEQVEGDLSEDGIDLFNNESVVEDFLQLPSNLAELESRELGQHLNAFTQQKMYTRTLVWRVNAELRQLERTLNDFRRVVFEGLPAKMSLKEKEMRLHADEDARETVERMYYLVERQELLNGYLESLTDGIFILSREVTRRGGDFKDSQRLENVGNKRR